MSKPLEHDYIGLNDSSLMPSKPPEKPPPPLPPSSSPSSSSTSSTSSTLKETELRLGLPGSLSPERKPNTLHQLNSNKNDMLGFISLSPVSGAKRVFSDAINGVPGKWVFSNNNNSNKSDMELGIKGSTMLFHGESKMETNTKPAVLKEVLHAASCQSPKAVQEKNRQVGGGVNEHGAAPAPKAQVVGWPPIRSFRKNSMASNLAKNSEDADGKPGFGCLYVKVSMDGAPYLRKVDLKTYSNYAELSAGLEKMFSCFTIGKCASNGLPGRDNMNESHLIDPVHGSEYVLTYEDKDGDWMLVGDVPWEMFTDTCRRLRIMKGSEAIGLAPRSADKCKNKD